MSPTIEGPIILGAGQPLPSALYKAMALPFTATNWRSEFNYDRVEGGRKLDRNEEKERAKTVVVVEHERDVDPSEGVKKKTIPSHKRRKPRKKKSIFSRWRKVKI